MRAIMGAGIVGLAAAMRLSQIGWVRREDRVRG
ncbi:glycine/D-amino acid oxidase-like deaminating enzyme [Nonomuraea africana]|uniref:Glycine/D-amino acid oxidase-like deaminating enzyme n=1 Tax=Nonomuraea africana TaxID=46171 RepID=A0ABR9KDM8_9ACTN|nr:glycine/D-amino acid oxidase-like deaminating enzyme [Nonomuraea africana]